MIDNISKIEDYKGVWVFADQRNGRLLEVGLELLGQGRMIADKLSMELAAILMGHNVADLADELGAYGADRVYLLDSPILENYRSDPYALLIKDLIKNKLVDVVITTCGTLDHDLARIWENYYHGTFMAHDLELHKEGVNRLGNIFIPNDYR